MMWPLAFSTVTANSVLNEEALNVFKEISGGVVIDFREKVMMLGEPIPDCRVGI